MGGEGALVHMVQSQPESRDGKHTLGEGCGEVVFGFGVLPGAVCNLCLALNSAKFLEGSGDQMGFWGSNRLNTYKASALSTVLFL